MKTIEDWNEGGGIWYAVFYGTRLEIQSFLYLVIHIKKRNNTLDQFFSKLNVNKMRFFATKAFTISKRRRRRRWKNARALTHAVCTVNFHIFIIITITLIF